MKHWKSILLLALVFVAGTGVGAFGMRLATRRAVQQAIAHPEHAQALVEYRLGRKLNLDESQRQKVREILTVARGKLKDLRHDFQPQMAAVARTSYFSVASRARRFKL